MLVKRLCGSPPLSTFAPSVRGARGPRWQANKIIIKGREKARRKKSVMRAHPTNPVEGCADANPKTELPNDT